MLKGHLPKVIYHPSIVVYAPRSNFPPKEVPRAAALQDKVSKPFRAYGWIVLAVRWTRRVGGEGERASEREAKERGEGETTGYEPLDRTTPPSGDKPHVGTARVTLHKTPRAPTSSRRDSECLV